MRFLKFVLLVFSLSVLFGCQQVTNAGSENAAQNGEILLPQPSTEGIYTLEAVLSRRFSGRDFLNNELTLAELSQVLWAAQGSPADAVSGATRTAPSAGATHPLEIYIVAGNIYELPAGIYRFNRDRNSVSAVVGGDRRADLSTIALGQAVASTAPVSIVIAADYGRTTGRYGDRGVRYVYMEVGHVTQNVHLQAEALGLGSVAVGAFFDDRLKELLGTDLEPLMIVPFGHLR